MFFRFILRALQYRKQRLLLSFSALAVARRWPRCCSASMAPWSAACATNSAVMARTSPPCPSAERPFRWIWPQPRKSWARSCGAFSRHLDPDGCGMRSWWRGSFRRRPRSMTSYWHVQGTRAIGPGECLAGETLAARLASDASVRGPGRGCTRQGNRFHRRRGRSGTARPLRERRNAGGNSRRRQRHRNSRAGRTSRAWFEPRSRSSSPRPMCAPSSPSPGPNRTSCSRFARRFFC